MDGVRPTPSRLRAVTLPRPGVGARRREVVAASQMVAASTGYVMGLDGVRRPARTSPRAVVGAMQASATPPMPAMAPAAALPEARSPLAGWRRPAIAFGLVAMALVASGGVAVRLASNGSTARAAAEAPKPAATVAPAVAPTATPVPQKTGLQQLLTDFAAGNPGKFGIVVKDLATGETAGINPDQQMESASLYKLFVAQRIYQQIDLGQLTYGKAAGGGTGRNIQDCLRVMINISDNDCGRALGTILGWGAQNQALAIEGYKATNLATPQKTSAGDVATLLSRLYTGTLVSANSTNGFMGLLKDQRVNNRLPVGLPTGTVIAHKTGDLDGFVHDAGIVYGPKTNYLVVVTSGPWNTPGSAPAQFAKLSGQLWNYFEQ